MSETTTEPPSSELPGAQRQESVGPASADSTAVDQSTLEAAGGLAADGGAGVSAITTAATDLESVPDLLGRIASMIDIGGPVVVVLLLMSFMALTIVIVKLMQFAWLRIGQRRPAEAALEHWHAGQATQALALLEGRRNPSAQALARAIRGQQAGYPEALVREEALRFGNDVLFQLRRGLRPLEVIGSLAPLLGLLGTVLGMIKAFQQLEAAGNRVNPAVLSGGIWEALLTTAVGLVVAIPVVAMLNWLERRVDHLAHDMDNLVTQAFTRDLAGEVATSSNATATAQPDRQADERGNDANTRTLHTA